MKLLLVILVSCLLSKACKSPDRTIANSSHVQKTVFQQQDTTIIYRASTRGYFDYISISRDTVLLSSDRDLKQVVILKPTETQWNKLYGFVQSINLSELPNMEVPTGKRHYDAAYHTTIQIKIRDTEVTTPTFDHDAPPKKIMAIVNTILSIRETLTNN